METTRANTPVTRIVDESDTGLEIHSRERKEVVIVAGELQGLFDLRAFYGATDAAPYFGLHNASTPWSGDIDRCSPHVNVSKWKTPTLILHGEKDYRVPVGEALALFEALQAHGVDSELVVYPDENHWILRPRNIRHWYGTVIDFLDRRLG